MVVVAIIVAVVAALGWTAIRADQRFRQEVQLPMQWSLTGKVTWSAPRRAALAVVPVLASLVLGFDAWATLTLRPRPGQEGLGLPVLLLLGISFVAIQQFHLWMIARSLKQTGR